MRKYISVLLMIVCCFSLCACGNTVTEATSETQEVTSALPDENLSESVDDDSMYILAQAFIDQPVDKLIDALGEPSSREYSDSCLGDGEDGNLKYDGFTVSTYKEGDTETVKGVYK